MTQQELKGCFKHRAAQIIFFTRPLTPSDESRIHKTQLIRNSTSAAANYRAACRGKSSPDFINKLKIVEEEVDESMSWLEFIILPEAIHRKAISPLYKEADELLAIIVASIINARKLK